MPISRFVAVSLRPASSVLSRTLARTGSVLRLDTARLTTDRPRARFSCMTESFTLGSLHAASMVGPHRAAGSGSMAADSARWVLPYLSRIVPCWVVGIFPLSSHPVITVVMVWIRWRPVRDRARIEGGRGRRDGGPPIAAGGAGGGREVDERASQRNRAFQAPILSTTRPVTNVAVGPGCPHRATVFHRNRALI